MMAAVVFVGSLVVGFLLGTRRRGVALDAAALAAVRQERRDLDARLAHEEDWKDRALRAEVDAAELRATLEGIKARRSEAGKRAWERRRAS